MEGPVDLRKTRLNIEVEKKIASAYFADANDTPAMLLPPSGVLICNLFLKWRHHEVKLELISY